MATDTYRMIIRHPWLIPAMRTNPMYGPGKARHDDHLLAVYELVGFTGSDAVHAATVVLIYVLGMALGSAADVAWQARLRRAGSGGEQQIRDAMTRATETAMQFPRLRARSQACVDNAPAATPGQELEFGLETILDGPQFRLTARKALCTEAAPAPVTVLTCRGGDRREPREGDFRVLRAAGSDVELRLLRR